MTPAGMTAEAVAAHDAVMKQRVPIKGKLSDIKEDFVPVGRVGTAWRHQSGYLTGSARPTRSNGTTATSRTSTFN